MSQAPDDPAAVIGEKLDHFEILARLGAGGMGVVYRARDLTLHRDVALKLLSPETRGDATARARMLREARMAAALQHPNICTVYEIGTWQDRDYIAMELVAGETLRQRIPRGGMRAQEIVELGAQIAGALAHAHGRHVIHRDLKSDNVIVTADGRVRVLDFGLARQAGGASQTGSWPAPLSLTEPGMLVGTPHYLAPEVLLGRTADERSDLWSLGVLLHEMATGELPFRGGTLAEICSAILNAPLPALPASVPAGLASLVRRCLEKDPQRRPVTAEEIRASLEGLAASDPPAARHRLRRMGSALALGVMAVVLAVWGISNRRARPHSPREIPLTSLPTGYSVSSAAIAPDGRYLAYADTGGYYLMDIATRRISPLNGTETMPRAERTLMAWMPDGRSLLVGTSQFGRDSLWAVSLMERRTTRLRDGAWEGVPSPDGRSIAFIEGRMPRGTGAIGIMDASGANARHVRVVDHAEQTFEFLAWSPTGTRLAYQTWHPGRDPQASSNVIETCDLRGEHVHRIFEDRWLGAGWGEARRGLCWTRDGRLFFYLPDSTQSQDACDLWSVQVDPRSGIASAHPRRVLRTTGSYISDLSASADGRRLACVKFRAQFDVFIAALPEGRRAPGPPRRLTLDEHSDLVSGWTPDSRSVLFLSARVDPPALFRQGLGDRQATPLLSEAPGTVLASVTPDGRWVLYQAARDPRLMRMPSTGGPAEVIASLDSARALVGCGTREGSPCILQRWNGDQLTFLSVDPGSGTSRELTRIAVDRRVARQVWALSPDGLHVATDVPSGPLVVDLRPGGSFVPRPKSWEGAAFLCWAADGGLWLGRSAEGGHTRLVHSDLAGHARTFEAMDFFQLSASPDGRWLAFDRMTRDANVWLLEGF